MSDVNNGEFALRSVARTIPLADLIPMVVTPCLTAFNAYSIWTNFPLKKLVSIFQRRGGRKKRKNQIRSNNGKEKTDTL